MLPFDIPGKQKAILQDYRHAPPQLRLGQVADVLAIQQNFPFAHVIEAA
jgi:hypothetical protein